MWEERGCRDRERRRPRRAAVGHLFGRDEREAVASEVDLDEVADFAESLERRVLGELAERACRPAVRRRAERPARPPSRRRPGSDHRRGLDGELDFSHATSRKSQSLTESSTFASLSGSCCPTSNVNATLRTSPGIMFEMSKRPSRSKRPSPSRVADVRLGVVRAAFADVFHGEVHRHRFAALDAPVAVAPAVVGDLVGVREDRAIEPAHGGADLGVGRRVPPAASNFTLRPSLRVTESLGIWQTRGAFVRGARGARLAPLESHQPSGVFAVFVSPGAILPKMSSFLSSNGCRSWSCRVGETRALPVVLDGDLELHRLAGVDLAIGAIGLDLHLEVLGGRVRAASVAHVGQSTASLAARR